MKQFFSAQVLIPVLLLSITIICIIALFILDSRAENDLPNTKASIATEVSPQPIVIPAQVELPPRTPRVVPTAPHYNERNEQGLSPNIRAREVGKRFLVQLPANAPVGKLTPLEVTTTRAAKYYPIKDNEYLDGAVYFPSCYSGFEPTCFDGKSFPVNVKPDSAIIAIDLEFKSSKNDALYIRGGGYGRFVVDGEYITPRGSHVVRNISTNQLERFLDAPSSYIMGQTTQVFTLWVEVPHDQKEVTFIYAPSTIPNDYSINVETPALIIPLTFTGEIE